MNWPASESEPDRPTAPSGRDTVQVEALARRMASEWASGRHSTTESYLRQHPRLWDRPSITVRLIYEEICLRRNDGQPIGWNELNRRFPLLIPELKVLLEFHEIMRPRIEPPIFPKIDETIGGYRILRQIGQGGAARVFLVADANNPQSRHVLKIGPDLSRERDVMSILRHPFLMRLDSAYEFPERNIQVLRMPDLGGISFGTILDRLQPIAARSRDGGSFVEAAGLIASDRAGGEILRNSTWPQVIAWVGACLAEAIHHIHEKDLIHFDVKPSNVLITDDFTPILMDFHLTREPVALGSIDLDQLGGTPGYMSPEQKADIAAARRLLPSPRSIDARSDIFSLGCVLFECLSGKNPARHRRADWQLLERTWNLDTDLIKIVRRCLEPDPEDRFPSAVALSFALTSYLAGHPLLKFSALPS